MTTDEARAVLRAIEVRFFAELNEFERAAGVAVQAVHVRRADISNVGATPRTTLISLRIEAAL